MPRMPTPDSRIIASRPPGERRPTLPRRSQSETAVAFALIGLWLAAESLQTLPSPGTQSIKGNLQTLLPALLHPTVIPQQLAFHAAGTTLLGWALAAMVGAAGSILWLLVLAGAVAAPKTFLMMPGLDGSMLYGLILGWAVWCLLAMWREPRRSTALMLLLLTAYVLGALTPFGIRDVPEPLNLVPFAGFLREPMLAHAQALAANLCLYTGILALVRINGGASVPASIGLAILVLIFELIQTYLVGHRGDITEPLLILVIGQILRLVRRPLRTRRARL